MGLKTFMPKIEHKVEFDNETVFSRSVPNKKKLSLLIRFTIWASFRRIKTENEAKIALLIATVIIFALTSYLAISGQKALKDYPSPHPKSKSTQ